jgi:LuxR family transcriptional regulator, maltose regulon positive regulatory protein
MTEQSFLESESRLAVARGHSAVSGAIVAASVLSPPAARTGTVLRQALLDRLADSLSARLVLMIAPGGWGKTSLLRDWWLTAQDSGVAWLSVGEDDNDPMRFWSGVVASLQTVAPGSGQAALEALTAPGDSTPGLVETLLIDDLTPMTGRITLVLDDFHLVTSPEVRRGFEYLVGHLPPTLRLVVAARCDLEMPLARLRSRGELAEIRADQLRFSEAEAEQLFNQVLGLALAPEEIHGLWQRTEGWAAGLYLAGLPLVDRKDSQMAGFSEAIGSDNRLVFDYVAAEVLAKLPSGLRAFLLRTAVLGRFCASLCNAVTGSPGAQDLLEEIERRQLFLVPLDNVRRWCRYHAMFGEALRHELDRAEPGLAQLLHRRAATWHRQHGTVAEAIDHAIAAGDFSDARELVAAHWQQLLDEGAEAGTVRGWLDRLPPEMVTGDARMCVARALLASLEDPPEDARPWLAAAECATPQGAWEQGPASVGSAVSFYRALHSYLGGNLAAAEPPARRAAELELESGSACWRARTLALLAVILFWRGQDADARLLLEQVVRSAQRPAGDSTSLLALSCMAAISARQGDDKSARSYASEAAGLTDRLRVTVLAELTSADLFADDGDLAAAEIVAVAALEHAQRKRWRLDAAATLLCLARIYARTDRAVDARVRLNEAAGIIGSLPVPGVLADLLAEADGSTGHPEPAPTPSGRTRRPDGLTGREAEVLSLLTSGHTNLEIAAKLVVSVHTVERHLQNAYRKVGVRNRADAAAYMARGGA